MIRFRFLIPATMGVVAALACAATSTTSTATSGDSTSIAANVPAPFDQFTNGTDVSVDEDYIVIRTKSIPDHKSVYFATTDSLYEAYNGTNPLFSRNPNSIVAQQLVFRIPRSPTVAATHAATPLGPIGVALNGVAIFNQYAGPGRPLSGEINSFDQANGHPQQTGVYHYHVEPIKMTARLGTDALLGFLLDGFPVYGPYENGHKMVDTDLDDLHGHFGPTKEYPNGIYHYHITAEDPYINGAGFYGTAGTVGG